MLNNLNRKNTFEPHQQPTTTEPQVLVYLYLSSIYTQEEFQNKITIKYNVLI